MGAGGGARHPKCIASKAATKELTWAAVFGRDCVVAIQIPMNTVTIPARRF
jgi:hypothetical protein